MRIRASLLLAAPALLLAAGLATARQGGQGGGAPQTPPPPPLTMTSTAFVDGATLPAQYTCSAKPAAVNPPLAWTNVPKDTASFAIILHDLEPRARKGIEDNLHWMIWNLPGTATSVPEGVPAATAELPDGSRQSQPGAPNPGLSRPLPADECLSHSPLHVRTLRSRSENGCADGREPQRSFKGDGRAHRRPRRSRQRFPPVVQ